jgi:hypothetical protein
MTWKPPFAVSRKALELAREAASQGLVVFSEHARLRMVQEQVSENDVVIAMRTATRADPGDGPDRWRLSGGATDDGRELCVVVALVWNTIVVTVFSK